MNFILNPPTFSKTHCQGKYRKSLIFQLCLPRGTYKVMRIGIGADLRNSSKQHAQPEMLS